MALTTIGMIIAGAVANSVAFTGGNAIYHAMDKSGSLAEMHRHNLAMENLSHSQKEWNENRMKHLDYLAQQRQKHDTARRDFMKMEDSIQEYESKYPKPTIDNFYTKSDQQKKYEKTFITGSVVAGAIIPPLIQKFV